MRTQKPSVRIEGWAVLRSLNVTTYRELGPGNLLVGKVFGHPTMNDGAFVFSSPILNCDEQNKIVETRNTAYHLGEVSREYEAWIGKQTAESAA
jgi:hypothetical protein